MPSGKLTVQRDSDHRCVRILTKEREGVSKKGWKDEKRERGRGEIYVRGDVAVSQRIFDENIAQECASSNEF